MAERLMGADIAVGALKLAGLAWFLYKASTSVVRLYSHNVNITFRLKPKQDGQIDGMDISPQLDNPHEAVVPDGGIAGIEVLDYGNVAATWLVTDKTKTNIHKRTNMARVENEVGRIIARLSDENNYEQLPVAKELVHVTYYPS